MVRAVPNVPMPSPFHRTSGATIRFHPSLPIYGVNSTHALKHAISKNNADVTNGVAILEITTLIAVHTHEIQIANRGDNFFIYVLYLIIDEKERTNAPLF